MFWLERERKVTFTLQDRQKGAHCSPSFCILMALKLYTTFSCSRHLFSKIKTCTDAFTFFSAIVSAGTVEVEKSNNALLISWPLPFVNSIL